MSHKHPLHDEWEAVIGLEIHVELNTKSKLFSEAPNRFGDDPNTNITEVCTGQPGALPVLNKEAIRKAVQFGCAIQGQVMKKSSFDRKSYFYPDSPRNFQITQYHHPIIRGGTIVAEVNGEEKSFAVNRVHLEDDAGMLKHFSSFAGVDFNRAGCPLIEIVSEPCIHTGEEAAAYAIAVKAILQYIDASDCNMEEGSLRIDTNISVRKKGEKELRNKIEIKNMNSFSFMELAIKSEIYRQIELYIQHPDASCDEVIPQATYRWDPEKKETVLMRKKESADDYRYFPEPDLLPIVLTDSYIDEIRKNLPELPLQREKRYVSAFQLSPHQAFAITLDKKLADYFEEALQTCTNARSLSNWLLVEFPGRLKESGRNIITVGIPPFHVAALVNMIEKETITGRIAKSVADDMVAHPGLDPQQIVAGNTDYQPLTDHAEIEGYVKQVLAENPQSIIDFLAGREKAFAFLVGQVMKLSRGKASPALVNTLLKDGIDKK
jgi:aspartyl-tRNA(Asn)/glutamyl-tRNA(Gln) amidotransferase subunit B